MKSTFAIIALAASATATNFHNFPPFKCPGNTDNKCTPKQSGGFNFIDLPDGPFSNYDQFNFKGFSCKSDNNKRFAPRTGGKKLAGSCGPTKEQSPSFGSKDGFSLGHISVKPQFDCDLEFHYDMPDGSKCKHRNKCSKNGSTVKNNQCGGAHNVTIVFPTGQPNIPPKSTTCSVEIPTMSFDCSTASSTKPPKTTKTPSTKTTKSTSVATTASQTKPAETTTSAVVVETTSSVASETTSSAAAETTSSSSEIETTTAPETTAPPATTQPPFVNGTTSSVEETTSETTSEDVQETTSETSTFETTFMSTSTIFTTSVSTITSCAETVTNCPANSIKTTIVTVAQSTTICPVTETRTTVHTRTKPTKTKSSTPATVTATSASSAAVDTTTTSAAPVETLPCPDVVPKCMNTFLFQVGCSDNTDSDCYCPDEIFVKNIFDCIYAHGESAQIVSEAVIFFQGICAPHIPSNPAIATGATVTSYVTVTGTPVSSLAPVYTTVTVDQTTVVPCTDSEGSIIPSSSSTIIISTAITVPNVAFTTGTGTGSSVALVPAVTTPVAITAAPTSAATLITAPVGTGSFTPRPSTTGIVTVNGSGRVTAGFGLALAAVALVAAL
ncbi:hypothetical protein GE09DRAFT_1149192 [Coniochaeta sp. 2T2.1]|nr:hypothetical protein GE09DRAFT_1149192 [Coniochaeta sp. 2T2.1]